jgi:outer membrane receptor for ferrienterochelin and colicins
MMENNHKFKSIKIMTLSLIAVFTLALACHAEEQVQSEDQAELGKVVVTASRTEQKVKETPAAVEVITRDDIDKIGAKSLLDALSLSTSMQISPGMVGSTVSIRGMESRHLLILVDGKRLTSEGSYSTMNNYEWDRINLDNVERIEIVRGPGSSLYGSDALGGVVNVITKTAKKQELSLSYSPGRYSDASDIGTDNFSIRYATGKTRFGAWSINAGESQNGRLLDPDNADVSNYSGKRQFVNIAAGWDLAKEKQLDFEADFLNEDMDQLSQLSKLVMAPMPPHIQYENVENIFDNSRRTYSLGLNGLLAKGDYGVRIYYGEQNKVQHHYNYTKNTYTSHLHDNDRKTWTVEGRVSNQVGDKHFLTAGGEFRTETYEGTRVSIGKATADSGALYIEDEYLVNERLIFIPSVRYDDNSKYGDKFSPNLGATYFLSDHYRLKATIGKGFRAPSLDDLYLIMSMQEMGAPMSAYIYGNPDLKAEESTNYEISMEGEKANTFGKVAYFVNDVSNLITTDSISGTSDYTFVNVDEADISGVELELGRHLNDKFMIKLNHTYLDAVDGETNDRLIGRAKNQSSMQLHYKNVKVNGISAVLWYSRVDDYQYSSTVVKSYNTWNLSLNKRWNDYLSSYIRVDNLMNEKDYDLNIWGAMIRVGLTVKL